MQIRPAVDADAAAIAAIYNHYVENSVITFEEVSIPVDEMQRRVTATLANNFPWLVGEEDGAVVGYAYASKWKERSAYRFSVEVSVYLHHQTVGRGLGSQLYAALFQDLEQRDINAVIGGIALPNDASIVLHEKLGMEKIAHFKSVGFKFGQWIDVAYWQRQLKSQL